MTNTELVRQLKTASVQADDMRLRNFGYLMNTAAEKIDDLLDMIELLDNMTDMLMESVPQWISVKECFPAEDYDVIVTNGKELSVAFWHICNVPTLYGDRQEGMWVPHYNYGIKEPITHWMTLPYIPHERKEE